MARHPKQSTLWENSHWISLDLLSFSATNLRGHGTCPLRAARGHVFRSVTSWIDLWKPWPSRAACHRNFQLLSALRMSPECVPWLQTEPQKSMRSWASLHLRESAIGIKKVNRNEAFGYHCVAHWFIMVYWCSLYTIGCHSWFRKPVVCWCLNKMSRFCLKTCVLLTLVGSYRTKHADFKGTDSLLDRRNQHWTWC